MCKYPLIFDWNYTHTHTDTHTHIYMHRYIVIFLNIALLSPLFYILLESSVMEIRFRFIVSTFYYILIILANLPNIVFPDDRVSVKLLVVRCEFQRFSFLFYTAIHFTAYLMIIFRKTFGPEIQF